MDKWHIPDFVFVFNLLPVLPSCASACGSQWKETGQNPVHVKIAHLSPFHPHCVHMSVFQSLSTAAFRPKSWAVAPLLRPPFKACRGCDRFSDCFLRAVDSLFWPSASAVILSTTYPLIYSICLFPSINNSIHGINEAVNKIVDFQLILSCG